MKRHTSLFAVTFAAGSLILTGCGSDESEAQPLTFEEDVQLVNLDDVAPAEDLREVAGSICQGLAEGVSRETLQEGLQDVAGFTETQAGDMVDIAVRHECPDQQ